MVNRNLFRSDSPLPFPFPDRKLTDLFIVRFFNGFLGRAQGLAQNEKTAVGLGPGLVVDLLPLFRRNLADFCETKSIANLDTRCICRFNIFEKQMLIRLISYRCPTFSTFSIFSWTSLTLANKHQLKQSSCDSCAMIFWIFRACWDHQLQLRD